MKPLTPRPTLLAALALILAVNAAALAGAWYNRSGEPDSRLTLGPRELAGLPSYPRRENSGQALHLQWRMPPGADADSGRHDRSLSEAQMRELGFRAPEAQDCQPRCRHQAARLALVVLELDGPAYHETLRRHRERLEQARQSLAAQPDSADLQQLARQRQQQLEELLRDTRLYAVAVGRDRDALRQRYPDRRRHAIVQGLVRPVLHDHPPRLRGYLDELSVERINVPKPWHDALRGLQSGTQDNRTTPDLRIELAFGQRLEPWISAVETVAP